MIIYEFSDGSIVNLMAFESLTVNSGRFHLTTVSGTKYEISKEEFIQLKELLKRMLNSDENSNSKTN